MPVPRFWQRIERRYKSGAVHQFLLHLNIGDFIWDDVYGYLPTKDFLMEQMNRLGCNAIISYSRSEGITFPDLGRRDRYQKELGLARIDKVEPIPEDMEEYKHLNADFSDVGQEGLIRDPSDALGKLEELFRRLPRNGKVGLIISDVEKIAPNRTIFPVSDQIIDELILDVETLQRWAVDMQIKLRRPMILFLTENPANVAPELLANDGRTVFPLSIPLPDYEERLRYIRHLLNLPEEEEDEEGRKLSLPEGTLSEDFAMMTHGLTLRDIQDMWLTSRRRETPVSFSMVAQKNRISIPARSYGKLELMLSEHGLDAVGGMENTIIYMKDIVEMMKDEDTKRVPSGILMIGPTGTGKTMLMSALCRDMVIHVVKLDDIHSVGPHKRTEWDLQRALDVIGSLAPVVAFIDNIDRLKYTDGRDRDGKMTNLLMDKLIMFMSDPALRGRVLWVAASNRPDMIDPAFRKRGVLSDVIPFFIPDTEAREDILKKTFVKNAIPYDNRVNFSAPASRSEYCTGADLEVIALRSYHNARLAERDTVTEPDVVKAAEEFIPDYDGTTYEYMMLLALRNANLASLVPASLDTEIREEVYEDGKLSRAKINQRIRELGSELGYRRRDRAWHSGL